jgi:adenylate kinase family enzyme
MPDVSRIFFTTLSFQVKVRVAAYHQNLKALTDTYKNVLVRIDGDRNPDVIYQDVSKAIKGGH